jgi:hypothetical protein
MAAAGVRQVDEALGQRLDVVALERVDDARVVEVGVKAVGAQEKLVAGEDFEVERVPLDRLVDANRARDRVFVGLVRGGVEPLFSHATTADQLIDQRVVFGELDDLAGAQEVDAAVADVGDKAAVAGDEQGGGGGPHPALLRFCLAFQVDGLAGALDRVLEEVEDGLLRLTVALAEAFNCITPRVDGRAELVDRHLRGDLARGVAAHAVGDHEKRQLFVDEEVVLVGFTLLADVRRSPEG